MTRSTTGNATEELRDVARDALKLGGRCVGAARDWLGEKREEFNMGRAAGAAEDGRRFGGGARFGSGARYGGGARHEARARHEDTRSGETWSGNGAGVTAHGYRGIGPRGYRRDDARVREDVCDALTDSDALDASNITVTVQDGVIKLAGSVPHRLMKRLAEDLAEGCSGVRDVENALRVGPPPHVGASAGNPSPAGSGASHGASSGGGAGSGGARGASGSAGSGGSSGPSGPTANA